MLAALQTKTSIAPNFSKQKPINSSHCILLEILQALENAVPPFFFISSSTSLQDYILLEEIINFAPNSENLIAILFPIPLEEPVITIALFFKENNSCIIFFKS